MPSQPSFRPVRYSSFQLQPVRTMKRGGIGGCDPGSGQLLLCEKFIQMRRVRIVTRARSWIGSSNRIPMVSAQIDFLHCIAYSSNVCFYKLGGGFEDEIEQGLGIERLESMPVQLDMTEPPGSNYWERLTD